jgi:hypothetical protein
LSARPTQPLADLAETCWLCGGPVEDYDPGGNAWCEDCLRAGPAWGWQDLLDALPAPHRAERLAVWAAAAYHLARRPALWLDWGHLGTGETLQGPAMFARLGAALAGDDLAARREARAHLEALCLRGGLSLRT